MRKIGCVWGLIIFLIGCVLLIGVTTLPAYAAILFILLALIVAVIIGLS